MQDVCGNLPAPSSDEKFRGCQLRYMFPEAFLPVLQLSANDDNHFDSLLFFYVTHSTKNCPMKHTHARFARTSWRKDGTLLSWGSSREIEMCTVVAYPAFGPLMLLCWEKVVVALLVSSFYIYIRSLKYTRLQFVSRWIRPDTQNSCSSMLVACLLFWC